MKKGSKILLFLAAVAVTGCCVFAGVNSISKDDITTASSQESIQSTEAEKTTTSPVTTEAVKALNELIIGKWMDSAKMSGFEFFKDGTAAFTYVNLESFNIPFNGTAQNAAYTLEGNRLTLKYSIYTATIEKKYDVEIDGDVLYMTDLDDMKKGTYRRTTEDIVPSSAQQDNTETTQETTAQSTSDELIGSWINSDKGIEYSFKIDGTLSVVLSNAVIPSLGNQALSGEYKGVYLTDGNKVTLQYSIGSDKITQKYSFAVTRNSLSLTDESGSADIYTRAGTSFKPTDEKDLLGTWRDGANMSGYEFKENGIVKITMVDIVIPVIDFPINGTFTGGYDVKGNEITLSYSLYGNTISETFVYEISGNVLSLTNKNDNNVSTYIKK